MRVIAAVCSLVVAGGLLALMWVRRGDTTPTAEPAAKTIEDDPAKPVKMQGQGEQTERAPETYTGVIYARDAVDLAPGVEGTLETVDVRVGDKVAKGTKVAALDADALERAVKMAQATARAASADRKRAALELADARDKMSRAQKLGDILSNEEQTTLQNQAKLAQARLEAASAALSERNAQTNDLQEIVKDSALRAPIDGVIAARFQEPGAQVGPTKPVVRIINPDSLWLRFAVPEGDAAKLVVGLPIEARVGPDGLPVAGVVRNVSPEVDPASRMYFAEADLQIPAESKARVNAGLTAKVSFPH